MNSFKKKIYTIYSYEDIENKYVYVGLTFNLKKRHNQHQCKINNKYDTARQHFQDFGISFPKPNILMEYLTANEAKKQEFLWIEEYKKLGWNILNKAKTGLKYSSLGGRLKRRTLEEWYSICREDSKNYKNRSAYEKNCPCHYFISLENGWLEEFFGKPERRRKNFWTIEECKKVIKECKTRTELYDKYPRAFDILKENGILDEYYEIGRSINKPNNDRRKEYRNLISKYYDKSLPIRENARRLGIPKSSIQRILKELNI